jgi:hypothetical protein
MKETFAALVLGILIGMGIGPALGSAYGDDGCQQSARALEDIASTLRSRDNSRAVRETTDALRDMSRTLQSIDSKLKR